MKLIVKRLSPSAVLPVRGSSGAAGYDLSASQDAIVPARGKAKIKTDIGVVIPTGCYGRVAPRSSLAWKHALDVLAGVIDEDYRGEVCVILQNHSDEPFYIKSGDRIAQLLLERIVTPDVEEIVDGDLPSTVRGEGGFGSTGLNAMTASTSSTSDASPPKRHRSEEGESIL